MNYPEDSIQAYHEPWWEETDDQSLKRGRLIRAFLPHVDQNLRKIKAKRVSPTDHSKLFYNLEPIIYSQKDTVSNIPNAALAVFPGEVLAVYRAKFRPAIVVSMGGPQIPSKLVKNKPSYQTSNTILVAPYYGRDEGKGSSGYGDKFVERIKACEYSNFMWEKLPIDGKKTESILRFSHIQPLGENYRIIDSTNYCLSKIGLEIFDEWVSWSVFDKFDRNSNIGEFRSLAYSI
ncbi:MAG: hypothetical protein HQ517_06515 [SAR324 cluster bacterium]|nr:hypothetical protein [SAR324 cluster bacterium]